MYATDEATVERAQANKAALKHEREGYEARIAAKKAGRRSGIGEDLTEEQLLDRVKQVDAEIKRCDRALAAAKKQRDKADDDAGDGAPSDQAA